MARERSDEAIQTKPHQGRYGLLPFLPQEPIQTRLQSLVWMASSLRSLAMTAVPRVFESGQALSRAWDADLSHRRADGFVPSARRKGEATGSRRSMLFQKDLDFQIYSKYFQAF